MTSLVCRIALVLALTGGIATPAAAHGGSSVDTGSLGPELTGSSRGQSVTLRGCFLTAVMAPRPASVLQPVFFRPLDLSQTFYGPSPLIAVWGFDCDAARVAGSRVGSLIMSIIGVPVGLTSPEAAPLANNFGHALVSVDTTSPELARALRRAGLPSQRVGARTRHSRPGAVPSRGRLSVRGRYAIAVSASELDPTNPHDHLNRFEHRAPDRRVSTLAFSIQDAADRFCFPASGGCQASLRAPRGSKLGTLIGGPKAKVLAGFDHEKLGRVHIDLRHQGRADLR